MKNEITRRDLLTAATAGAFGALISTSLTQIENGESESAIDRRYYEIPLENFLLTSQFKSFMLTVSDFDRQTGLFTEIGTIIADKNNTENLLVYKLPNNNECSRQEFDSYLHEQEKSGAIIMSSANYRGEDGSILGNWAFSDEYPSGHHHYNFGRLNENPPESPRPRASNEL